LVEPIYARFGDALFSLFSQVEISLQDACTTVKSLNAAKIQCHYGNQMVVGAAEQTWRANRARYAVE
jgi:hypothetical protein